MEQAIQMKEAPKMLWGAPQTEWCAAFAPTVQEYYASQTIATNEGGLIRTAFGRRGAPIDEQGNRDTSSYAFAVTMTIADAGRLFQILAQVLGAGQPVPPPHRGNGKAE